MVKIDFAKLQLKLQEERDIKIINEGVIPEFTRTTSARLTAFRLDPIRTFKMYAESAGVELRKLFDELLDEEFSVDLKEFKNRIKVSEILSRSGIEEEYVSRKFYIETRYSLDCKIILTSRKHMPI